MYSTLRTLHLIFGAFSLPFLIVYAVSAVQMAHSRWFDLKPSVREWRAQAQPGAADGRAVARAVMREHGLRGEVQTVQEIPDGFEIRLGIPGTTHNLRYSRADGQVMVRTSTGTFLAVLNRLHHAAGLWHEYAGLWWWGIFVALVSVALLGLSATGLVMWWMRRQERAVGLALLISNLLFSIAILIAIRSVGP